MVDPTDLFDPALNKRVNDARLKGMALAAAGEEAGADRWPTKDEVVAEMKRSAPRKGDWCQTYSGRMSWPMDPRPGDFHVYDIAHALATTNRFGGHARRPYSIAQHSLFVSRIVPPELALVGLLHDAAEAFCGDMTSPLKRSMPEFREAEKRIARAIGEQLGLGIQLVSLPAEVKHADLAALATEARDLMRKPPMPWNLGVEPRTDRLVPLSWSVTKAQFLCRFFELTGDEDPGACMICEMPMELVRPGKSQPTCTCWDNP